VNTARFCRHNRSIDRLRQRGFSMVELMVALVIGLILVAAMGYVFISSRQAYRSSDGLSRIQENTRSAVLMVNTTIRLAGYIANPLTASDPTAVFASPQLAIFGGKASALSSSAYNISPSGTDSNCTTNCDFVEISYQGASDGSSRDCQGATIAAGSIVSNVFYISKASSDDASGPSSLYCWVGYYNSTSKTFTTVTQQPLVYGVTLLNATYGVDSDGDQAVDYYATAAQIGSSASAWTRIKSVQITLTVKSPDTVNQADTANASSDKADNTARNPRLERNLTQIIQVRNRLIQ
jgi:type IV pilus assembly protein PilW